MAKKITNDEIIVGISTFAIVLLVFTGLSYGVKYIVIFYHEHTTWFWFIVATIISGIIGFFTRYQIADWISRMLVKKPPSTNNSNNRPDSEKPE